MSALGAAEAVNAAVTRLVAVTAALNSSHSGAEEANVLADHAKGGGLLQWNTISGATRVMPGTPPATETRRNPNGPDSRYFEEVRRIGWPKNTQGKTSARGLVFDAHGNPIGGEWKAEPHGLASDTSRFNEPWRSDIRYTIRTHVEGQVAAMICRTGITKTEVYLNLPPCGARDFDPVRCHQNVKHVLPVGSTMTVWAVRGDRGMPQKYTFSGTREALK